MSSISGDLAGLKLAPTSVPRLLLTPEEAATALGIGRTKLFSLLRSRQLPSVMLGGSRRIRTSDLVAFTASLHRADGVGEPAGAGADRPAEEVGG
jgi:excisionase family DNA binding protein